MGRVPVGQPIGDGRPRRPGRRPLGAGLLLRQRHQRARRRDRFLVERRGRGRATLPGRLGPQAFLAAPGSAMISLGTLGWFSHAAAVNDRGQVVGNSTAVAEYAYAGFVWDRENGLGVIASGPGGLTTDINSAGTVVGAFNTSGAPDPLRVRLGQGRRHAVPPVPTRWQRDLVRRHQRPGRDRRRLCPVGADPPAREGMTAVAWRCWCRGDISGVTCRWPTRGPYRPAHGRSGRNSDRALGPCTCPAFGSNTPPQLRTAHDQS